MSTWMDLARKREWTRGYIGYRRASGICVRCPTPVHRFSICLACRIKERERRQRKQQQALRRAA